MYAVWTLDIHEVYVNTARAYTQACVRACVAKRLKLVRATKNSESNAPCYHRGEIERDDMVTDGRTDEVEFRSNSVVVAERAKSEFCFRQISSRRRLLGPFRSTGNGVTAKVYR